MSKKVLAGRYELLERRGNGGMAVVYKSKDCLLNRYVAIKILKPEFIRDPKFIDNFRRESQAAAKLTDPNIVSVYDVGREGNIYYIVMELMEGSSLGEIIQNEAPLSEQRALNIARQIAAGLSSAHKKKIVHRDIKPHNILMSEDGTAKIADFGIAKAVSGATVVNSSTTVMGSVHYLSPEQARGGYVDIRTDIYSLGIVLYEMLTGTVPFDGDNAVTVAMMHINNDIPAPSLLNPAVSPAVDKIVRKMAARNPADRYSSADELISALDNAANGISAESSDATRVFGANDFYHVDPQPHYDDGYGDEPDPEVYDVPDDEMVSEEDREDTEGRRFRKVVRQKTKPKNGTRRAKILGIILALVCAVPLSILILHAVNNLGEDTIAVPDVRGMTEEQAAKKLEKKGLEYELGSSVISKKYDEGQVVNMEPEAGTHVKEGYTVTLKLARGNNVADDSDKVKIPDVTNITLAKARTILTDEGLKVGEVSYEYSDSVAEGSVLRQDPGAGDRVKTGSAVDLTVSRGEEHAAVQVPNLMGMTRSQASNALEKEGLTLGDVTEEYSSATIGTVMRQGVKAGTSLEKGSAVNISLSKGSSTPQSSDNSSSDNTGGSSNKNNSSQENPASDNSDTDTGTDNSGNSGNNNNSGNSGSNGNHSGSGNHSGNNSDNSENDNTQGNGNSSGNDNSGNSEDGNSGENDNNTSGNGSKQKIDGVEDDAVQN